MDLPMKNYLEISLHHLRGWWLLAKAYASLVEAERRIRRDGIVKARAAMLRPWKRQSRVLGADDMVLDAVNEAIDTAALYYWKPLMCLHRSIVAYQLLRNLGAQPLLHIGARTKPFGAHAWTTVAGRPVGDENNEATRGDYVVLDTIPSMPKVFSSAPAAARGTERASGDPHASLSPTTRIAVAEHIRFAESKGEVIVMDQLRDSVRGIDGPWGVAFLALARGETLGDVTGYLCALYDAERAAVEADIHELVANLLENGWVASMPAAPPRQLGCPRSPAAK